MICIVSPIHSPTQMWLQNKDIIFSSFPHTAFLCILMQIMIKTRGEKSDSLREYCIDVLILFNVLLQLKMGHLIILQNNLISVRNNRVGVTC